MGESDQQLMDKAGLATRKSPCSSLQVVRGRLSDHHLFSITGLQNSLGGDATCSPQTAAPAALQSPLLMAAQIRSSLARLRLMVEKTPPSGRQGNLRPSRSRPSLHRETAIG